VSNVEDWKLQVSFKSPSGDLINLRAGTGDEMSVLLENISELSGQIAATGRMLSGANALAPLATPVTTPDIPAWGVSSPTQAPPASPTPAVQGVPTCAHGPRKFLSGVSKKNNKPYSMWVCTQPQGQQCEIVNG